MSLRKREFVREKSLNLQNRSNGLFLKCPREEKKKNKCGPDLGLIWTQALEIDPRTRVAYWCAPVNMGLRPNSSIGLAQSILFLCNIPLVNVYGILTIFGFFRARNFNPRP